MKLTCPLSGITWEAEGFITGHRQLTMEHPIFHMDTRGLVARESDWAAGRLSEKEKKLLFLAVLNHSKMVRIWSHPANPSIETVEKHYLHLLKLTLWKQSITSPRLSLPGFAINKGTSAMDNFHFWLMAWEEGKKNFLSGQLAMQQENTKLKLESYLEAKIRAVELGVLGESEKYLKVLANWADIAAQFPKFKITHPFNSKLALTCGEYWKEIICTKSSVSGLYPTGDIKELEDHLIDNLDDISSLYAGALIRRIRRLLAGGTEDLGLELLELPEDDMFPGQRRYQEVVSEHAGSDAAMAALAADAPEQEPVEKDYATRAKYLVARIKWNAANKAKLS